MDANRVIRVPSRDLAMSVWMFHLHTTMAAFYCDLVAEEDVFRRAREAADGHSLHGELACQRASMRIDEYTRLATEHLEVALTHSRTILEHL